MHMLTPIAGFAVAFVLAFGLTPLVCRLALRLGAIDKRARTRIHARDVPRLGGLAIAAAFYVPIGVLALWHNRFYQQLFAQPTRVVAILGGGLAILALGTYDDL